METATFGKNERRLNARFREIMRSIEMETTMPNEF